MKLPSTATRRRLFTPWWRAVIIGGVVAVIVTGVSVWGWYMWSLTPRDTSGALQMVTIESGTTPAGIGARLESEQLIRSARAFQVYVQLNGESTQLQAGRYKLSASMSVSDIVGHLVKGENDTYDVTILPGMTLKQLADPTVEGSLASQGFTQTEISQAFAASYDSPLFATRPSGASLEGYIFPETYKVSPSDSLEVLLQRSFDELYQRLTGDDLITQFSARGLTVHQALTLGSIIQKEDSDASVQPQIAQVFLSRLAQGMELGSDVTYMYAADQLGVTASPSLESPYNTRKYKGLPPGPIATMNYTALQAVASPASGDYLYFVAGDDGQVYFSRTLDEHESLVEQHCTTLCQ